MMVTSKSKSFILPENIQKMSKEKKTFDNLLVEFQREVIESQTTIWRELHNVRNILSTSKTPSK
jgi:hypothetical protein